MAAPRWQQRAMRDMRELTKHFEVRGDDGELDLKHFQVRIHGPPDSPYAGAKFWVRVTVPDGYPWQSPSVGFVDHVYHPNVDWESGSVCLDVLNANWSAVTTFRNLAEDVLPLFLASPNPLDPYNQEAAGDLLTSFEEFAKHAKERIPASCLPQPNPAPEPDSDME